LTRAERAATGQASTDESNSSSEVTDKYLLRSDRGHHLAARGAQVRVLRQPIANDDGRCLALGHACSRMRRFVRHDPCPRV
jgi:hypothetical protein